MMQEIKQLEGKILKNINRIKSKHNSNNDCLEFETIDGDIFKMEHLQECFEDVHIEDICGDLMDLINTPILLAEEVSNHNWIDADLGDDCSETWTFYKFRTIKGSVDIRWHGSSNGYYSEKADFYKMDIK